MAEPGRTNPTRVAPGDGPMTDPFAAHPFDGSRFQVLALDGGGLKGIYSAAILAALEKDLQHSVLDHFDLITGTSTGGLIALGLGAGLTPVELVGFYSEIGPKVFPRRRGLMRARQLFAPKYDAAPLRGALTEILGDRILADSRKRLVIPSFNLGDEKVHVFKTPHHPRLKRDWRVPMVDIAMATAAAPTFFPAHNIDHMRLIDGGVWANNPTSLGIAEAVSMFGVPLDSIRVFSLGTTSDLKHRARRLDRGGIIAWARSSSILDVVLGGQSVGATNLARHLLGEEDVLRIDPEVPEGLFALDRVDADELIGKASTHSRIAMPYFERAFADHHASDYKPLCVKRLETSHV